MGKKLLTNVILLFLLFGFSPYLFAGNLEDKNGLNKQIDSLVSVFSDGPAVTYPEFRTFKYGKLFDSENDAVAIFSIEGFGYGNMHVEYIAFFSAVEIFPAQSKIKQKKYQLMSVRKIGGRGWRTFNFLNVVLENGVVSLPAMEYKSTDPGCCPSKAIKVSFKPEYNGEIIEIKN